VNDDEHAGRTTRTADGSDSTIRRCIDSPHNRAILPPALHLLVDRLGPPLVGIGARDGTGSGGGRCHEWLNLADHPVAGTWPAANMFDGRNRPPWACRVPGCRQAREKSDARRTWSPSGRIPV
jgi:hypothetical protein